VKIGNSLILQNLKALKLRFRDVISTWCFKGSQGSKFDITDFYDVIPISILRALKVNNSKWHVFVTLVSSTWYLRALRIIGPKSLDFIFSEVIRVNHLKLRYFANFHMIQSYHTIKKASLAILIIYIKHTGIQETCLLVCRYLDSFLQQMNHIHKLCNNSHICPHS
jgi:hypothetical protein